MTVPETRVILRCGTPVTQSCKMAPGRSFNRARPRPQWLHASRGFVGRDG